MAQDALLARTVVATASCLEVGLMGSRAPVSRHATDGSGAVFFALAEAAPDCVHLAVPGEPGPVVDAVAYDVSSVAHPGRLRGLVRLSGPAEVMTEPVTDDLREHLGLAEDGLVGRLVPDTVTLEWTVERGRSDRSPVDVDAGDYALADIDALGGWQDGWMAHLDQHHRDDLRDLVAHEVQPVAVVRPVHADERGIVLREHMGTYQRDIRVAFPQRVRCGCEAVEALTSIMAVHAAGVSCSVRGGLDLNRTSGHRLGP
ncbi:Protein of unknown function [Janibacter indicus]|uniref:DUF2470 domain-containing protein n=2 Tax=Intrasporangiaceae TaxID=85021 RepID=A0A1W2B3L7_9MICO|nr:Protein of unknown function [Janibacter indicus]